MSLLFFAIAAIIILCAFVVRYLARLDTFAHRLEESVASVEILMRQDIAARFPAFTPQQIGFAAEERRKLAEEYARRLESVEARRDNQEAIAREGAEDIWLKAQAEHAEKLHDLMVESNIAVGNGKKTLKQVREEWSEVYFGAEWMNEAVAKQKEWREKTKQYADASGKGA